MTKITPVHLSDDLAMRLEQLAASVSRPKAWLIEQEAWQIEAFGEALAKYQRGDTAIEPHDQVMTRLVSRIRNLTA